jgi:hypothetical protein
MEHKAFAFGWDGFVTDLHDLLVQALETGDPSGLTSYVDTYRASLSDPYEGAPLGVDWRDQLELGDVQELGDLALTRFYDPSRLYGVGNAWLQLGDTLPEEAQAALLGFAIGPPDAPFDPGRMGSYFQSPAQVRQSLAVLEGVEDPALVPFRELLRRCARENLGIYVTF